MLGRSHALSGAAAFFGIQRPSGPSSMRRSRRRGSACPHGMGRRLTTGGLPVGKVVAVGVLVDVVRIGSWREIPGRRVLDPATLTARERAFGNYDRGRYAWLLRDIQEPVDASGALNVWDWHPPDTYAGFLASLAAELELRAKREQGGGR